MLIGFPCKRPRRLQKHYICIQRMTVPFAASCGGGMKRERLCNSGTIPVAVTSTTKPHNLQPLPPAGDGKACRPEGVRRPAVIASFGAFGAKSFTMKTALRENPRTGRNRRRIAVFPQFRSVAAEFEAALFNCVQTECIRLQDAEALSLKTSRATANKD